MARGANTRTAREALTGRDVHVPKACVVLDAETCAALGTTTSQDFTAAWACHTGAKTVVTFTLEIAGLISTFRGHDATRSKIVLERPESIDNFAHTRQAGCAWRKSWEPLNWASPTYPQQRRAAGIRVFYANCLAPLS